MKRKSIVCNAFILFVAILFLLSACGSNSNTSEPDQPDQTASSTAPEPTEATAAPADGYLELGGIWDVEGIFANDQVIPDQYGFYDCTYLCFSEDGSFLYTDVTSIYGDLTLTSGTYSRLRGRYFVLKTDKVCTLNLQDGESVETESTSSNYKPYIVTITADDENSLLFSEYDPITGKAKVDDDPLVFVKSGQDSLFINGHKIELPGSSNNAGTNNSADGSQEDSLNQAVTSGEKNALSRAKSYLDYTAFSYSGLIEQLEYEGFTESEAKYGADHCGADWYEQAAKKAKEYLNYSSFSKSGLIEQLEYEGFTPAQAEYGVNKAY